MGQYSRWVADEHANLGSGPCTRQYKNITKLLFLHILFIIKIDSESLNLKYLDITQFQKYTSGVVSVEFITLHQYLTSTILH